MYNKNILGWMLESELQVIENLAKLVPPNSTIVEIGSMFGRSTYCWATSCDPSINIYSIDIFSESYVQNHDIPDDICIQNKFPLSGVQYNLDEEFSKNTGMLSNVHKIKGFSPYDIKWDGKKIDLLFLDALHSNPSDWENLQFYMNFLNKNAYICGHDYDAQFPDVIENVSKLEKMFNTECVKYPKSTIWLIRT